MDEQGPAVKPIAIKFSSCRGVAFEIKPSPARPFALDAAAACAAEQSQTRVEEEEHLAGIPGDVRECPNVPRNVRAATRESKNEAMRKKRDKENRKLRIERDIIEGMYPGVINIEDDDEHIQMSLREQLRDKNVSRAIERRCGSGSGVCVSLGKRSITAYFDKELSSNKVSMQPKISTALNVESKYVLGQAWAKFFQANDIAGRKANCPYFRAAMKITQNLGPAPIPTGKEIDGVYLDKNYEEAGEWLKMFKQDWKNYGVTVMCDSWTGPTGMSLINFMVYCNTRMFFHKSIDASSLTQNSEFLYKDVKKVVVEEIGHENVVQIVTDNGSNYKKACRTLVEEPEYNHIVWQPCAAHTVNLMLKDIAKFCEVGVIVKSAKQISEWWFQFGGEVPNLQKCALRIVSQCVSSSGCERNWSAFAMVHTKQRNRLLYGKLHKCVSVRHNLKIRAEEDQDDAKESYREKEVDPCALMMDTAMYDASNPMMEWLMEDEEHAILDGTDAASAVFEELRSLNSRRKESRLGTKDNGRKRKRIVEEEEEDDYIDCDDEEDEQNEHIDIDDEDDDSDDSESEADGGVPSEVEEDGPDQVENEIEGTSDGNSANRRSARLKKARKGLFTVYKRLFVLCVALNAAGLATAATGNFPYAKRHAALFAMGNILALTLCRSEAVLRAVFWLAVALLGRPWMPVAIKTGVTAILQSVGGVHSGCGVSSLAWLVVAFVQALEDRPVMPREIMGVASAILALLALSSMAAFPLVRHLHHNVFERTHRFAGWTALVLLWAFVVLSAGYDPTKRSYSGLTFASLAKRQELWLAAVITFFTFLPWLTVRRVPVTVTAPSTHASIITFQGGVKAGLLGRISRSPLSECHTFGIISDDGEAHAMLTGAVGDFTRGLVSDPPSHLWVRRVHFAGLPYLISMYRRVTMVATGSSICVFMSFLLQPSSAEVSLVWVAKEIDANYGEGMSAMVTSNKILGGRVVVHDTATMGRPNVAELAVGAARRWNAEVVIVTSNPEGSRDVVSGCKKAGISAFGPIWDS
ncbi:hypothetical protein ACQ4PT_065067 [Festuca glaucescens]